MPVIAGSEYREFQNPSSGWPMILHARDGRLVVEPQTDDRYFPTPAQGDVEDAGHYTEAIAHCEDIDEAARLLYKTFGADDLRWAP
jgi:hypothetical protein